MKDSLASAYTMLLEDEEFRTRLADDPAVLNQWDDLDDEDKWALVQEAGAEVSGFSLGAGPVMSRLQGGPPLSPNVGSKLGSALNVHMGLPSGALDGPGYLSNVVCCPWGPAFIP